MNVQAQRQKVADTGKKFLPKHLLLKFFIGNPDAYQDFRDAGVPLVGTTHERLAEIQAKHEAQAKELGRDPKRFSGENGPRIDSGTPVFNRNGISNIFVGDLGANLEAAGYILGDCHLQYNPKKDKDVLVLAFYPKEEVTEVTEVPAIVKEYVSSMWQGVYVWRNPDWTITVNCNGKQQPGRRTRKLEMDTEGGFSYQTSWTDDDKAETLEELVNGYVAEVRDRSDTYSLIRQIGDRTVRMEVARRLGFDPEDMNF